jgi:hypothetical protein
MADVGFLENHKLRFTMPLSARSRCDPHEYTVRVTPDIVERATAMVSKEIECACDFCECLVVTSRAPGHNYGNTKYFPAFRVTNNP